MSTFEALRLYPDAPVKWYRIFWCDIFPSVWMMVCEILASSPDGDRSSNAAPSEAKLHMRTSPMKPAASAWAGGELSLLLTVFDSKSEFLLPEQT